MKTMRKALIAIAACAVLLIVAATSRADLIGPAEAPTIIGSIVEAPGLGTFDLTQPLEEYEFEADTGKYKLKGEFTYEVGGFTVTINEIEFEPDPFSVQARTPAPQ